MKKATARRLRTGWSGSVRRMTKGTIPTTAPAADRYDLHDDVPAFTEGEKPQHRREDDLQLACQPPQTPKHGGYIIVLYIVTC